MRSYLLSERAQRVCRAARWLTAIIVLAPTATFGASREASDTRATELKLGEELFAREWVPGDPRSNGGDGLGPAYNATSCQACHNLGGPGGAGSREKNVNFITRTVAERKPVRRSFAVTALDGSGGGGFGGSGGAGGSGSGAGCGTGGHAAQTPVTPSSEIHPAFTDGKLFIPLHHFTTDPDYGQWWSKFVGLGADPNRSGLDRFQQFARNFQNAGSKRGTVFLPRQVTLVQRNAPPLFGLSLLDTVTDRVLSRVAAEQPEAMRGRASHMADGRLNRFGWKAEVPNLQEFVLSACANELGLEVPGHHQGISPITPEVKKTTLDLTMSECNALVAYVRSFPAPSSIDWSQSDLQSAVEEGQRAFETVGCATCHTPDLGAVKGVYSDLLLHDMGELLNGGGGYHASVDPANSNGPMVQEWRTPPLWGFHDSGPYLHDGRAATLDEAIREHRGQAEDSARQYFRLTKQERSQIRLFLRSLVAPGVDQARVAREVAAEFRGTVSRPDRAEATDALETHGHARSASRLQSAQALERMGKTAGALEFYRAVVRDAPGSAEAKAAAGRIKALENR